jgi:D-3-phosphoglycerate dehydrogenase / 2-oxoglutarate reductase
VAQRILVTDHVSGDLAIERSILEPSAFELDLAPATDEDTLASLAPGVAGILACYADVTSRVIEAAAGCHVISRYGVGHDNIDLDAATRAGILVTYVPDYCADEVADHTLALLLAAARKMLVASQSVRAGDWRVPRGGIHRLSGQRLALIGLGRIGRKVAERATAFGLNVIGYDPMVEEWDLPAVERMDSLEDALVDADFVSLHAPLTADSYHLIDADAIALMRRTPILINASRGGLVDLDAIMRGLDDGRLAGVALDVVEPEPLPSYHPLRGDPRAVVTPHMSYYSEEAQAELQRSAADEVLRALSGQPPRCPLNLTALRNG